MTIARLETPLGYNAEMRFFIRPLLIVALLICLLWVQVATADHHYKPARRMGTELGTVTSLELLGATAIAGVWWWRVRRKTNEQIP